MAERARHRQSEELSQSLVGIVRANPHLDHVVFDWMKPARIIKVDVLQDEAAELRRELGGHSGRTSR